MGHTVITVSREFGSGGRSVGERLAKRLGIPFYDRTLVELIARQSSFPLEFVEENDQRLTPSMLYQISVSGAIPPWFSERPEAVPQESLFDAQRRVIRELADRESCVIIGRCADHILAQNPDCLTVFLSDARQDKAKRCVQEYGLRPEAALGEMQRRDRERANYYAHYTGKVWGEAKNYHLCLQTDRFGLEGTAEIILSALPFSGKSESK